MGGKVSLQIRSQYTVGLSVGYSQLVEIRRKAVSKKKRKECIMAPNCPLSLSELLKTLGL